MSVHQKKRKFEMGRPSSNTKLGIKRVRIIRTRGGNSKFRALRLDAGNFSWATEQITNKARILDTVYNASNAELVRTKTVTKNTIVQIDATPFRHWYSKHYGVELGKKKGAAAQDPKAAATEETKKSGHVQHKLKARQQTRVIESSIEDQFASGRLLACISSRPGQSGRADGYILEGEELAFYLRKLDKKKKQ